MLFSEYTTPLSTLKYSPQYFTSLTFARADSLDYPHITKPGLVEGWCFSSDVPATAAGTLVQPGEVIPCLQDLLPISREMQQAFTDGSRSVDVVLNHEGQRMGFRYHFSKIRLLIAINNYHPAVVGARSLYRHVIANGLLLSSDLERLGDLCIDAPISGFHVTQFQLWKLACFLGEIWLEEDVVNSLLELLYLQETMKTTADPSLIILPTS
ncbi:hypothetical protein C8R44DRAFT_643605, partial [Mycena epipterygia]